MIPIIASPQSAEIDTEGVALVVDDGGHNL